MQTFKWSELGEGRGLSAEKEMATHSSILAWRIPGTEELGGLSSMGSHRVGHNRSDLAAAAAEVLVSVHILGQKDRCGQKMIKGESVGWAKTNKKDKVGGKRSNTSFM